MDLAMAHMAHPRFLLCSLGLKKMVCTWVSTPNNEKMPGIWYTHKLSSYGQSPIDDLLVFFMVIFYVAMLIYQRVTQPQLLKIIPVCKARQGRVKLDQCHRKVFSLRGSWQRHVVTNFGEAPPVRWYTTPVNVEETNVVTHWKSTHCCDCFRRPSLLMNDSWVCCSASRIS